MKYRVTMEVNPCDTLPAEDKGVAIQNLTDTVRRMETSVLEGLLDAQARLARDVALTKEVQTWYEKELRIVRELLASLRVERV